MSAKGIALRTHDELTAGSRIEVTLLVPYEISLTKTIPVRMNAEVIRVMPVDDDEACDVACVLMPVGRA